MTAHHPDPAYDCRACRLAWPCAHARAYLLVAIPDRRRLAIRMQAHLGAAVRVLAHLPPGALFDRFIKWTRPREPSLSNTIRREGPGDT